MPVGTAITNVIELQAMENDLAGSYYLANNIDASATSGWNGGLGFDPVGDFEGIFDGNGHTITDLYINRPTTNLVGLFGSTTDAEIKNVGLIDVNICGREDVGSLVGFNHSGTLDNSFATGAVDGFNPVGGLIGTNHSGVLTNVYSICAVSGSFSLGGLIGYNSGGTYNDCFWDTQTSGQATSAGGTGKTTAQMKQEATFTNWDFSTIWAIVEGVSYPTLR